MNEHNIDSAIPITSNVVFALRLDVQKDIEHIIIGELPEVQRYMRSMSTNVLIDRKRPFGSFILDCSNPIANELADVRAILSDSMGKRKSPMLNRARGILDSLWQSDNLVYKYVAVRIWQEYNKACAVKSYDLYGAIEAISLPLMFSLKDDIREWQENEPQNPLVELMPEYFNRSISIIPRLCFTGVSGWMNTMQQIYHCCRLSFIISKPCMATKPTSRPASGVASCSGRTRLI